MSVEVISGTRRQVRELVDGTLEVRIHVDPRFVADFHRLFPKIDAPVALAPLVADFERQEARPKGGPIAQWLGARCGEQAFRDFLAGVADEPVPDADAAAEVVRLICGVSSRAEIDHDDRARLQFERVIRVPFGDYLRRAEK